MRGSLLTAKSSHTGGTRFNDSVSPGATLGGHRKTPCSSRLVNRQNPLPSINDLDQVGSGTDRVRQRSNKSVRNQRLLRSLIAVRRSLLTIANFPDSRSREFDPKSLCGGLISAWRDRLEPSIPSLSLFFSLLPGNSALETGSGMTASATTHSLSCRDFPG